LAMISAGWVRWDGGLGEAVLGFDEGRMEGK